MSNKVGRNDPCHCGSGKKSKFCHGQSAATAGQKWMIAIGAVILVSVGYIFYGILTSDELDNPPPGKVWSPEHGHWHDDAPTASPILPQATTGLASEPPGEPPQGKVWSSEHGHWHDAPVAVNPIIPETSSESTPQPEEAPPGKVWSPEHGHLHDDPNEVNPVIPEPPSIRIPK